LQVRDFSFWNNPGQSSRNRSLLLFFGESEGLDAIPSAGPIKEDKEGNIWFAGRTNAMWTKKGGIYKYDGNEWVKYNLGKKNLITDLLTDSNGEVWVAEGRGIYKFEDKDFKEKRECAASRSYVKIYQDSKGTMWFGRGSFKGEIDTYTE
jgi:ligand-binding sensor domain-containing protein